MAPKIPYKFIKNIFEKADWKVIVFVLVILLAIFLRVYHFSDWLFFKMDQARDAFTAKQALESGPGYLSLLGPKAGSTNVKLGPIFYYFQYLAAVLFHSASPAVLAYPDLLFSILTIPLLFLFLRKYFSRDWSMILTSVYALSFLVIEYSRFAWNPNSLPFFNLLFFYSLLNIFDENIKYKYRWVILAGFSAAVSTQLHFLSFLTLPTVTILFLIFNRKKLSKFLNWKKIIIFIGIVLLLYVPVFAHEIYTHGGDTKEFFKAIHSKAPNNTFFQNVTRDLVYFGQNWFLIMTSYIGKNKEPIAATLGWLIFIIPGLYLNFRYYRRETDDRKKNFLLISLVWFLVYLLSYIPISYDIRPRFFLPLLVLPFIFFGYSMQYLTRQKSKIWQKIAFLIVAIIIGLNITGTYAWFKEMKVAQKKGIYPKRTIILKARDGIVLWHLEKATDYIISNCKSNDVYFDTISEYHRPMTYLLELNGRNALALSEKQTGDASSCFYALKRTRAQSKKLGEPLDSEFSVVGEKKFGAWTVLSLQPNETYLGKELPSYKKGRQTFSEAQDKGRVYWKDIIK